MRSRSFIVGLGLLAIVILASGIASCARRPAIIDAEQFEPIKKDMTVAEVSAILGSQPIQKRYDVNGHSTPIELGINPEWIMVKSGPLCEKASFAPVWERGEWIGEHHSIAVCFDKDGKAITRALWQRAD